MIAKLVLDKEIRLCSGITTFHHLLSRLQSLFPSLHNTPKLTYTDSDGDTITLSSDMDLEALKDYSQGKIIKIQITREDIKQVRQARNQLNEDQEDFEVIEDHHELIGGLVKSSLESMYRRATQRAIEEEEQMIQELARHHVHFIGQRVLNNALAKLYEVDIPIKRVELRVPRCKSSDNKKVQKSVQQLVQKKIKLLLPTLVERVTRLVEMRSRKQSCEQCDKYKRLINKALLLNAHDLCNEEEFEEIFASFGDRKCKGSKQI